MLSHFLIKFSLTKLSNPRGVFCILINSEMKKFDYPITQVYILISSHWIKCSVEYIKK